MTISAVSGNAQVQANEQGTNNTQKTPAQQNSVPQDTVTISSSARAMQNPSASTDVDHDGDSK